MNNALSLVQNMQEISALEMYLWFMLKYFLHGMMDEDYLTKPANEKVQWCFYETIVAKRKSIMDPMSRNGTKNKQWQQQKPTPSSVSVNLWSSLLKINI